MASGRKIRLSSCFADPLDLGLFDDRFDDSLLEWLLQLFLDPFLLRDLDTHCPPRRPVAGDQRDNGYT